MTIVLIGPPAAGKSRTGKRLARVLGMPFADTDQLIAAEHGPIPQIFAERGEAAFRALEREVVASAIRAGGVLSLGGGAAMDEGTQQLLAPCVVLLVTASPEAIEPRIAGSAKRPLLRSIDDWIALHEQRREHYERLASASFDTSFRPMSHIIDEMVSWLREAGVVSGTRPADESETDTWEGTGA